MNKIIILTILLLNNTGCLDLGSSKNEILKEVVSPKNSKKAIFFIKYSGATSDNSLQISLKEENYKLKESENGNIFTSDSDHGQVRLDTSVLKLLWINEDTLSVQYSKKLRVFVQNKNFLNTVIKFEPFEERN